MIVSEHDIARKFERSSATYSRHARVQRHMASRLVELTCSVAGNEFERVLEIGAGPGTTTQALLQRCSVGELTTNDLVAAFEPMLSEIAAQHAVPFRFVTGNAEFIQIDVTFQLLISGATMQWFHDPVGFLRKAANWIEPGGWLVASVFGPLNLLELRKLTGLGLQYPDYSDLLKRMDDFELQHFSSELVTFQFDSPMAVLEHLRKTGVNAMGKSWGAGKTRSLCKAYQQHYSNDNGVLLTYQPVYFAARKR